MTSPVDTLKALRRTYAGEPVERAALDAAIAALSGGEAVGYANPGEYAGFASGEDHTFRVYRHGVPGKDVAIYTTPRAVGDGWPSGVLARDKTLEVLRSHNDWRRGGKGPQTDPRLLGLALDAVIEHLSAAPSEGSAQGGRYSQAMIESAESLGHHANAEYMRQRASTGQVPEVAELVAAATELRQRQRDYLSQPKGERIEDKGRLVGAAAERLDAALAAFTPPASPQGDSP